MKKFNKKGFTILELIVVMVIIGVLVLLAVPKFKHIINRAKLIKIQVEGQYLSNSLIKYSAQHNKIPFEENPTSDILSPDTIPDNNMFILEKSLVETAPLDLSKSNFKVLSSSEITSTNFDDYKQISESFIEKELKRELKGKFFLNTKGDLLFFCE